MTATAKKLQIKDRERIAILQALRFGVVPRLGIHHIQVGRKEEVTALLRDLQIVGEGSAAVRFVAGRFGTGKTFFLQLLSAIATEKNFLVARADLTTDRRLQGANGQARSLLGELLRNLASKARPEGNALDSVLERWVSDAIPAGTESVAADNLIASKLAPLRDMAGGADLAIVLGRFFAASLAADEVGRKNALRWIRAEYATKTEARQDLRVRSIVNDSEFYDHLKLMARFFRLAGYAGLVIEIDELVVLTHRLSQRRAREVNLEVILRIVNDCLQGQVEGLMVVFGGTDEAIEDQRRGLFSYEALRTRLTPNPFASGGRRDLSAPVLKLAPLRPEDLYVLLHNIRDVHAFGDASKHALSDAGLEAFVKWSARNLGDASYRTPRETVAKFVGLLSLIDADPALDWPSAFTQVGEVAVPKSPSAEADDAVVPEGDDLSTFKL